MTIFPIWSYQGRQIGLVDGQPQSIWLAPQSISVMVIFVYWLGACPHQFRNPAGYSQSEIEFGVPWSYLPYQQNPSYSVLLIGSKLFLSLTKIEPSSFIKSKDHNYDFRNNTSCRKNFDASYPKFNHILNYCGQGQYCEVNIGGGGLLPTNLESLHGRSKI